MQSTKLWNEMSWNLFKESVSFRNLNLCCSRFLWNSTKNRNCILSPHWHKGCVCVCVCAELWYYFTECGMCVLVKSDVSRFLLKRSRKLKSSITKCRSKANVEFQLLLTESTFSTSKLGKGTKTERQVNVRLWSEICCFSISVKTAKLWKLVQQTQNPRMNQIYRSFITHIHTAIFKFIYRFRLLWQKYICSLVWQLPLGSAKSTHWNSCTHFSSRFSSQIINICHTFSYAICRRFFSCFFFPSFVLLGRYSFWLV